MLKWLPMLTLAIAVPQLACADGFGLKDLRQLNVDTSGFAGGSSFSAGANDPDRLTVFCQDCEGQVIVDVRLTRSTDGTEQRYRSGETTIEKMEGLCKSNNPTCQLDAAEQGEAVGWVTRYDLGETAGSTTVLFLNGDQLIVRSIAPDTNTAAQNGSHAVATIGRTIIEGQ